MRAFFYAAATKISTGKISVFSAMADQCIAL
jgi:hypothetical protein